MPATLTQLENMTLTIDDVIRVNAPIDITFESLIESLQDNATPQGPFPMKLEPWPGGRWYRDLGDNNGHFWAVVQAIKRPSLLEFSGPLMMSFASVSNVQYRLKEENGVTIVTFHHYAFGPRARRFPQRRQRRLGLHEHALPRTRREKSEEVAWRRLSACGL